MKFTQHTPVIDFVIRGYSATTVRVGERELARSCLVAPNALISDWSATSVRTLSAQELEAIYALQPEIAVLAAPGPPQMPPAAIRAAFAARRIGLEVMELGAGCRTYNVLLAEGRRAVAAIVFG
jgi:uncharacterized protein